MMTSRATQDINETRDGLQKVQQSWFVKPPYASRDFWDVNFIPSIPQAMMTDAPLSVPSVHERSGYVMVMTKSFSSPKD